MVSGPDADTLEVVKAQLELILKRLDSAESKITAIMQKEEENNKMLTSFMDAMQQMGLLSQPYRKSDKHGTKAEDSAYL